MKTYQGHGKYKLKQKLYKRDHKFQKIAVVEQPLL